MEDFDARARQLREEIREFGWKESVDFIARGIELVADLYAAGHLSRLAVRTYQQDTQFTLKILPECQDGPGEAEVRRLHQAVRTF